MMTGNGVKVLALIAISFLVVGGCKKEPEPTEETAVDIPEAVEEVDTAGDTLEVASERELVVPLIGVGDVRFGMSKDEVVKHFGRPDKILGKGTELNYVSSRGLSLTVHPEVGTQTIKCWSDNWPTRLPFPVTTFAGTTKKGIGMGATQEQIVAAYGQPDRTGTDAKKGVVQNLHYDKLRIKFSLWQGKLMSMILEAPK